MHKHINGDRYVEIGARYGSLDVMIVNIWAKSKLEFKDEACAVNEAFVWRPMWCTGSNISYQDLAARELFKLHGPLQGELYQLIRLNADVY